MQSFLKWKKIVSFKNQDKIIDTQCVINFTVYVPIWCQTRISPDLQSGSPCPGSLLCGVSSWCVLHCTTTQTIDKTLQLLLHFLIYIFNYQNVTTGIPHQNLNGLVSYSNNDSTSYRLILIANKLDNQLGQREFFLYWVVYFNPKNHAW